MKVVFNFLLSLILTVTLQIQTLTWGFKDRPLLITQVVLSLYLILLKLELKESRLESQPGFVPQTHHDGFLSG